MCWNIDPQKRPSAADAVNFLEENGLRITQLRDGPVSRLDKRVNNISVRAVAEGGYSNVWQGTLDEKQLVGGQLFAHHL